MKLTDARARKKTMKDDEVDITSLLDILVTMLFFLIANFNASDLTVNLVDDITLPFSENQSFGNSAVIVQMKKNLEVWVNDKQIGHFEKGNFKSTVTEDSLKSELESYAATDRKKRKPAQVDGGEIPLPINLVFDKGIEYEDMQRVMKVAASVGYTKYKLIVQGFE